jgi:N,N'-diacetyllegionaminate synthase
MKTNEILIVAEVAQAHDGSLGILHSLIDALADTGVNAVKFQTHIAEAESSIFEPFRINFSYEDLTRYDYWKRMEFTIEQWFEIKAHCDEKKVEFMSTPFSNLAVDYLEKLNVKRYKIGSGDTNNFLLLEKISKLHKPIILSSGMSSFKELDSAVSFLSSRVTELSVLQCNSSYPTKAENIGLNVIQELKDKYHLPVGFSDHSGKIFSCLSAATKGAQILEFHATFDRRMFGPDAKSSLTIEEIKQLVEGVRYIETALNNPFDKNSILGLSDMKTTFEKTICVNKTLPKDYVLKFDDLEAKRPANKGISAAKYLDVVGKSLTRNIEKYEFINEIDLK